MNSLCYFVLIATSLTLGQAISCNNYNGPKANASLEAGTVLNCNEPRRGITDGNHKCYVLEYYSNYDPNTPKIERGCVYELSIPTFCSAAKDNALPRGETITSCKICETDCTTPTSGSTALSGFYTTTLTGFALILLRSYRIDI